MKTIANVKSITVLYTCASGAGGWSILRSLEGNDRYRLIGVDGDHLGSGLYQNGLNANYKVPFGDSPDYIKSIVEIVKNENVDVIWPTSDEEVKKRVRYFGIKFCRGVSYSSSIRLLLCRANLFRHKRLVEK